MMHFDVLVMFKIYPWYMIRPSRFVHFHARAFVASYLAYSSRAGRDVFSIDLSAVPAHELLGLYVPGYQPIEACSSCYEGLACASYVESYA